MPTILIVDDEQDIVNALKLYLAPEGYDLLAAGTGLEALELVRKEDVQLVLMDVMMPRMDGITATAKIREISNIPIILLTAKSENSDKILGLNIGADDYITKPFEPTEVLARVRSQLRRYTRLGGEVHSPDHITIGGLELDTEGRQVFLDGEPVSLTPLEFRILRVLMESPGKVFSTTQLYEAVWQCEALGNEGTTVAVHIRHIREKIEIDPANPRYVKMVWGSGYKMEVQ